MGKLAGSRNGAANGGSPENEGSPELTAPAAPGAGYQPARQFAASSRAAASACPPLAARRQAAAGIRKR